LGSNQFEEVDVDVNNHLHFTNLKEVKDQDEKTTLTDHLSNFLNIPLNMVILGNNFSIFRNFLFG
jgi:hypothetical protein